MKIVFIYNIYFYSGGGSYFDLNTGIDGFGLKVSIDTMIVFLKRYGVPESFIASLKNKGYNYCESIPKGLKEDENRSMNSSTKTKILDEKCNKSCFVCENQTSKTCSKCNLAFYCSKECQTKDWKTHKLVCSSSMFPKKILDKSVYGLFLPENSDTPRIVEIPLIEFNDDECALLIPNRELFVNDRGTAYYMTRNPLKPNRTLTDCLEINYRDEFQYDGSQINKAAEKITQNKMKFDWKGPLLITKIKGRDIISPTYIDFELKDYNDIIDYFISYG